MSQTDNEKKLKKEAMKQLRTARKETIKAATLRMKEQKKIIKAIKEHIGEEGTTVPELSEKTGMPTSEVLWYVATLKKYGEVLEGAKDGSYYRYLAAEAKQAEEIG